MIPPNPPPLLLWLLLLLLLMALMGVCGGCMAEKLRPMARAPPPLADRCLE
jgi:hypothetical protein